MSARRLRSLSVVWSAVASCLITFTLPCALAQTTVSGQWVWVGGDNKPLQNGSLGTQGVPAATNLPFPTDGATVWGDSKGRTWLFGGYSDSWGDTSNLLWLFDPSQGAHGEWTLMSPASGIPAYGTYGTQGAFSSQNIPPTRVGATSWTDLRGRLWLFGGWYSVPGPAFLNDLWVFDPNQGNFGEWAWMGGQQSATTGVNPPGVYGTLGQPAPGNTPGGRCWGAAWTDAEGNLWLYGGDGFDANSTRGSLNDLWVFRSSEGQYGEWTWMGGGSILPGGGPAGPLGGQPGQFAAGNTPGGRYGAALWTDSAGHLWLFGGEQDDSQGNPGEMADMWQFDPSQGNYGEWAFMGGSSVISNIPASVTGTQGIPAPGNLPAPRKWAQFWKDSSGDFWLYGGDDYVPNLLFYAWSDLWVYSPTLGQWAQINGGTDVPDYGTEYLAASSNYPGWRDDGQVLSDSGGNVLIFGGRTGGITDENDLWQYTPPPTVALPDFSIPGGYYANPPNVSITDSTPGAAIYYTTDGSIPSAASSVYAAPITVTPPATLNAVAVISGYLYSPMGSAVYTSTPTVAAPTFSPAAGTYTSAQTVAISDTTTGAAIYYTTDGTTPTTSSTQYSGAITVSTSETIQALATASGDATSPVATATYTITPPAATPAFSVSGGTYTSAQSVTLSDTTEGATIFYTTDGTTPTTSSIQYSAPISVSKTETILAIATASGYSTSAVAAATYTINLPPPSFTLASSASTLSISSGGSGNLTLTITPQNGFNSAVTFACSGLPSGATCSFNPSSVTPSGTAAATTQLTFAASAQASAAPHPFLPAAALALAGCLLGWKRLRAPLRRLLLLLLLAVGFASIAACGSGGGTGTGNTNPPPVTATVTVTATSGSLQQVATIILTVN